MTGIQWTDVTWNPVTGCTKVSAGCQHCYAEALARRFAGRAGYPVPFIPWTVRAQRRAGASPVMLRHDRLDAPLHWKKPRMVFVNSMSDLFHDAVPDEFILQVWSTMARAGHHTFQVLTKRPERMQQFTSKLTHEDWEFRLGGLGFNAPLPNVWLGVSVEDQRAADERLPILAQVPAAVRFVSYEPALGPVDFSPWLRRNDMFGPELRWLIIGGESGPHARPFDLAWARDVVRQCREVGVPLFLKQLGSKPVSDKTNHARMVNDLLVLSNLRDSKGGDMTEWPEDLRVRKMPR